jgi:hypothetical protein
MTTLATIAERARKHGWFVKSRLNDDGIETIEVGASGSQCVVVADGVPPYVDFAELNSADMLRALNDDVPTLGLEEP